MRLYFDTSAVIAAVVDSEAKHSACLDLLLEHEAVMWNHGLTECFSILTGGRLGIRVAPNTASQLLNESIAPRVASLDLPTDALLTAFSQAEAAGARGGAIYDYLHLHAARASGASRLITLNDRHFAALAGPGDPEIVAPG